MKRFKVEFEPLFVLACLLGGLAAAWMMTGLIHVFNLVVVNGRVPGW